MFIAVDTFDGFDSRVIEVGVFRYTSLNVNVKYCLLLADCSNSLVYPMGCV